MPDLHDLLGKLSDDEKSSSSSGREKKTGSGITPLEIAQLPEPQKSIMFFLLRDEKAAKGLTLPELAAIFPNEALEDTIQKLIEDGWLVDTPEGNYKVNLGRSRRRLSSDDLWKAISND